MAFRVSEYGGFFSGRPIQMGYAVASGFIRSQFSTASLGSTGSTGTGFTLSSGTRFIMIDSDVGALVVFGSSVSTSPNVTSTMAQRIPASAAPIAFYVNPYMQLFVSST